MELRMIMVDDYLNNNIVLEALILMVIRTLNIE